MFHLIRIIALLLILITPLNVMAEVVHRMSLPTIKRILAHHQKNEPLTVKLKNGESHSGTLADWNNSTITLENLNNYNKRVISLADVAQIKFGSNFRMSISTTKRDLLQLGTGSLNLFMLLTTGKMLTKE